MSKLSEQVENQIKVSEKVVASARAHAKKVAEALAARVVEVQGAETKVKEKGVENVVVAMADILSHATHALRDRELAYAAEQADDGPIRAARDASEKEMGTLMSKLRATVETSLGREALATYGLQGETPRGPRKVLNHVKNVANLMRKKPANVTTAFGATFSTEAAVVTLEAKHAELASHIRDDDREARELEEAMTHRDRSAVAWSEAYQGIATALEGLYRLAGWRELSERVRPTQRTLRGEEAGPEIDEGAGGTGGGGEPADGRGEDGADADGG